MSKFIECTTRDDSKVLINLNKVISISKMDGYTYIEYEVVGKLVKESYEELKSMIYKAQGGRVLPPKLEVNN